MILLSKSVSRALNTSPSFSSCIASPEILRTLPLIVPYLVNGKLSILISTSCSGRTKPISLFKICTSASSLPVRTALLYNKKTPHKEVLFLLVMRFPIIANRSKLQENQACQCFEDGIPVRESRCNSNLPLYNYLELLFFNF